MEKQIKHNFIAIYSEFPDLLFGELKGGLMVNATAFLKARKSRKSITGFRKNYREIIQEYAEKLKLPEEQLFWTDEAGNVMINSYLAFSFISYVDPAIVVYFHDRLHELFTSGFVVSDRYLALNAAQRLSRQLLLNIAEA